jgi:hypothetical protein
MLLAWIALHARQWQAEIYFIKVNEVYQLKILPHLGSQHFKLRCSVNKYLTMLVSRFLILKNISKLLKTIGNCS